MRLDDILYATDFSAGAMLAFETACALARETSARLVIAHVHELPIGAGDGDTGHCAAARGKLDALAGEARAAGVPRVDVRVAHGHAWHRIVDIARAERCALIVLGMRGHSTVPHIPIGSVAEEVTRNASCSVLIVRPREAGGAAA
jgi:nucleotide-binding universal stress UspA family protein